MIRTFFFFSYTNFPWVRAVQTRPHRMFTINLRQLENIKTFTKGAHETSVNGFPTLFGALSPFPCFTS